MIRVSFWLAFFLGFSMVAPAGNTLGWDGHRIVCQLAYERLGTEARAEVDRLLQMDPNTDSFADACVWADQVRPNRRQTAPWHYINTQPGDDHVDMTDCPDGGCVLSALEMHSRQLADPATPDAEKLEALKFFSHWVGDVHQPMHVSIAGNRGGNDFEVRWRDRKTTNLHAVWDRDLIEDHEATTWPELDNANRWSAFAETLEEKLAGLDASLTDASYEDWANESFSILRRPETQYMQATVDTTLDLGQPYFEVNHPVIVDRMLEAAVRLAAELDRLLAPAD